MNFKKKLLIFSFLFLTLTPSIVFAYSDKIILGGNNIGIKINSKNVMVVGFYKVDNTYIGEDAGLKVGDLITKINDREVSSIDEMISIINNDKEKEKLDITFKRNDKTMSTELELKKDNNGVYKTGLYVKDQINGIGTLTYIDPNTKVFGALGHEIIEKATMLKVEIKIENRESVVYVDGKEINEDNLQSDATSLAVSKIAKDADNSKFYAFGKKLIDVYKKQYNLIISGRDLMKIYPDLDYHFFVTADIETRVDRKMHQYTNEKITREELKKHIEERDSLQEQAGFYKRYDKTIDVDVTECKSAEESAMKILEKIN